MPTPTEKFIDFHIDHPQVYDELVRLAREAKAAGKGRIGIRMLWEVARWNLWLGTSAAEYKLNNNYHSRYARFIMHAESDLAGIFAIRELKD